MKGIFIIMFVLVMVSCASRMSQYALPQAQYSQSQPSNINNICQIFTERPDWHQAAKSISISTKFKIPSVMAFMYQESAFRAEARPHIKGMNKLNGTAYGFAQVLKSTWEYYKKKVNKPNAKRNSFYDSYEFIVWYMQQTNKINAVEFNDIASHYLNYHEGWTGFKNKTFLKKPWLVDISKKVSNIKNKFTQQYSQCQNKVMQVANFSKKVKQTKNTNNFNANSVLKSYNNIWF